MKAKQKTKKSVSIECIYERVKDAPETIYKIPVPHFEYVSNEVKAQLINDGYKVYIGDFDGNMRDCLIIEW